MPSVPVVAVSTPAHPPTLRTSQEFEAAMRNLRGRRIPSREEVYTARVRAVYKLLPGQPFVLTVIRVPRRRPSHAPLVDLDHYHALAILPSVPASHRILGPRSCSHWRDEGGGRCLYLASLIWLAPSSDAVVLSVSGCLPQAPCEHSLSARLDPRRSKDRKRPSTERLLFDRLAHGRRFLCNGARCARAEGSRTLERLIVSRMREQGSPQIASSLGFTTPPRLSIAEAPVRTCLLLLAFLRDLSALSLAAAVVYPMLATSRPLTDILSCRQQSAAARRAHGRWAR
ncbi:hypothetical protein FB451DRAFT_1407925 [Mycena latifolia]|nr:hypothetical protein FB451DRAFT_1407925 [Mycena latifolia]